MSEIINVPMTAQRDIQTITAEIKVYVHQGMVAAIEIGRRLVEAKEMLGRGEWGTWLEQEANISQSNAQIYMNVFREYGSEQQSLFGDSKRMLEKIPNLTAAHELLAIKDLAEREKFVEEHDLSEMSTRELKQAIRERDEAMAAKEEAERLRDAAKQEATGHFRAQQDYAKKVEEAQKKAQKAEEAKKKAEEKAKNLQKQVKELEERKPEMPADEMEKLRREAEEKALQEMKSKADGELADAKARAEKAEQELEKAKKQLAAADKNTAQVLLLIQKMQEMFGEAVDKLADMEQEKADKLRGGLRAILQQMEGKL